VIGSERGHDPSPEHAAFTALSDALISETSERAPTAPQLSAAQKTAIFIAVSKSMSSTQANFQASIGEKVPSSVELHTLPRGCAGERTVGVQLPVHDGE
jgi:hypothetical protein